MNHINHVLLLILRTCQSQNPADAQLRDILIAAIHPPLQNKRLLTDFNIQIIGYYTFHSLHPVCFSFVWVEAISFIN